MRFNGVHTVSILEFITYVNNNMKTKFTPQTTLYEVIRAVLQLNYCIAYINVGVYSWSLQSFARNTLSDYVPKAIDLSGVINSSISNLSNLPPIQNNNPASAPPSGNASSAAQAPPPQPTSSAPPRTTPQPQPQPQPTSSVKPTTTPTQPQPSGIDLLKKVLDQEEDKAYLKKSKWRPGKNLFDTVNDEINKKNEEAFMKKLGETKKKKTTGRRGWRGYKG
jgi:hypothetical protein